MTIDIENDNIVIAVGSKGGGDVGTSLVGQKAGVGVAAADAGAPRPQDGEEDGWNKVEKGKKRSPGRPTRAAATRKKIIEFDFNQISETSKKRRAETDLNEADKQPDMANQLAQLKDLVLKLLQQQQDMMQKQEEDRKQQNEDRKEIQQLKQLVEANSVRRPACSEALSGPRDKHQPMPATDTQIRDQLPMPKPKLLMDDKRMVIINTLRAPKQEKQDYTKMKEALDQAINNHQATRGCQIKCLRPLAGERVGVVFKTEEDAERAKKHVRWHQTAMPGARMQSERCFPVKFDGVAKQAVLDSEINDDKTLSKDICINFQTQNHTSDMDCTAHMARWISEPNALKKTGSLVLWLKHQLSAERLIQMGTALFGATDAYCTRWETPSTTDRPCSRCNKYEHKQYNCTRAISCGICTGSHNTRECTNQGRPRCPACSGSHTVFDRKCTLHPRHIKPHSMQSNTSTQQGSNTSTQQGSFGSLSSSQDMTMSDTPSTQC